MMRKIICTILAFVLAAGLCACGSGSGETKGASDTKENDTTTTTASSQQEAEDGEFPTGQDYDDLMNGLNSLTGDDDRLGVEYFKFPEVSKFSELPDASVWTKMGMIDLTPSEYENGNIYDDGTTIVEGLWNGFAIECDCSEDAFKELVNKLWEAGYRGVACGNGEIADAEDLDDVFDSYDNEYVAFYNYDGWTLCAYLEYYDWDNNMLAGVYDAKTMINNYENLRQWPSISWNVTAEAAPSGGIDSVGSDFCGNWGDYEKTDYYGTDTYSAYIIYAYNVTRQQFESYAESLSQRDGLYVEEEYYEDMWENWSAYYEDENPNGFYYFYFGYCEALGMVYWNFE